MRLKAAVFAACLVGVAAHVFPQSLPKPAWIAAEIGGIRLEGDQYSPSLGPVTGLGIGYEISPYAGVAIRGSGGWSGGRTPGVAEWDRTLLAHVGAEFHVQLSPLARVSPFVLAGAGVIYWDAQDRDGRTLVIGETTQSGTETYVSTGGGVEFRLSPDVTLAAGVRFDYNLTDALDVRPVGRENDQTIAGFLRVSLRFGHWFADDRDGDGVPNALDLAPSRPEDDDGYFDHDGAPEGSPALPLPVELSGTENNDETPPVVLHHPVRVAVTGKPIAIRAKVYEDYGVKVVALLHRVVGSDSWNAARMRPVDDVTYEGQIPAFDVRPPGLEYCVVAVDQALTGLGYSGMLDRPNVVRLISRGTGWRVLGGVLAGVGWGAAGYLIWNRQ